MLHSILISLRRRLQEGLRGIRVILQEVVVGNDDRCIVVKGRLDVLEVEEIARYTLHLGIQIAPAVEDPDGICLLRRKRRRLVCDIVRNHLDLVKISAILLDDILHHRLLGRQIPGRVSVALQSLRPVKPFTLPAHDSRSVVLQDRRDRRHWKWILLCPCACDGVLRVDRKLRLTRSAHLDSSIFRRLNNLDVQPCILVVSLLLGDEDARMIGVRRPVQAEGDLSGIPEVLLFLCRHLCSTCQRRR